MTPEGIAIALIAAAAVTGVFWTLRLRRILPLELALEGERRSSKDRDAFVRELLEDAAAPTTPQALEEAIQFGAGSLLSRIPGPHLFVWVRRAAFGPTPASEGELACHTGALEGMDSQALRLPEELWDKAFHSPEGAQWRWAPGSWAGLGVLPEGLAREFEKRGLRSLRLTPWGSPGKVWGLLGVLSAAPEGIPVDERRALSQLTAYYGALAQRTVRAWEGDLQRTELDRGLQSTLRRLDDTNLRLIQRAKEIKTLHEVSDVIVGRQGQPDILGAIVSIVAQSLEADVVAFLLLDDLAGELVTQPGAFGLAADEGSLYRISLRNPDASSVRVFQTAQPFLTGDAQSDPDVISHYARLWKCHSLMVVPLRGEGGMIGVMRVGSFKKDAFSQDHLQFVEVIAEEAAVLVESAVLSKQLSEMNLQLTRLHRLKDEFVSTVSHEFKTPLTAIQGFLAVLLEEEVGPLGDEQKRFLRIAKSASERLGALVTDMLDISKLEGGLEMPMAPVALGALAERCVETHRLQAETRGLGLALNLEPRLPNAHGNESWLQHVLENLLSNAIKFTPSGGKVTLTLESKGECLRAAVSDTGVGIPAAEQPRIFEKFFRASNRDSVAAPGTGLGLAICKQVIEKHEGRIWFESEEGRGTCFYFVVSAAKGPPSPGQSRLPSAEGAAVQGTPGKGTAGNGTSAVAAVSKESPGPRDAVQ
ncbi:MAG: hypothetical protein A2X36_08515 [Elusimicrobia bacterium GWA2_69_24]|nr:MAG: hypothetical protein A2X36_08515 [Elusimicrobia bacterium GWA2_69_24]HBL16961.1 hypothetical protein [Elusimicrobiota bacterium]